MGHTIKNLVVTQIQTLATFALFSLVRSSQGLFTSFGFTKSQPAIIAYTLFSIVSAPLSEVSSGAHLFGVPSSSEESQDISVASSPKKVGFVHCAVSDQ